MTREEEDLEALRDWWDGLRDIEQFAAYVAEKSNADGLAHTKPVCTHGRPYGLHEDGEDCATFRTVREFSESLATVRVLGLTMDELRVAVAIADQYHPQWRRSSQKPPSTQGE